MKVALPRSMALKIATHLEKDISELESAYWDFGQNRVTPREMRLEIERLRKWVGQIRGAAEPSSFTSGEKP